MDLVMTIVESHPELEGHCMSGRAHKAIDLNDHRVMTAVAGKEEKLPATVSVKFV